MQLFNIKMRTLGFAFCQPPKKSLPKSLTQKKSLQNFKPKKSPQIANFKPKKGLCTSLSLIYLSTPPPLGCLEIPRGWDISEAKIVKGSLKKNWNFQRCGGFKPKTSSVGSEGYDNFLEQHGSLQLKILNINLQEEVVVVKSN